MQISIYTSRIQKGLKANGFVPNQIPPSKNYKALIFLENIFNFRKWAKLARSFKGKVLMGPLACNDDTALEWLL